MSYEKKDQKKFEICTHIFGYGSANSSSAKYNTSQYLTVHADAVVGISVNGDRPNRIPLTREWVQQFTRLRCAIVADSTYHRNRSYNIGERELAKFLKESNYVIGVDNSERAIWYHKDDYSNFIKPKPFKSSFRGDYYFLSNMFPCVIPVEDLTFYCVESAYQACKDVDDPAFYQYMDGYEARKYKVKASPEFHKRKLDVMRQLLEIKFSNPFLMEMLKQVPDEDLVEVNTWGDTYWGVCNGVGENHLGKLLQEIKNN